MAMKRAIVELTGRFGPQLFPFNRASKFGSFRQLLSTLKKARPVLVIMEGTGIAGGAAVILAAKFSTAFTTSSAAAMRSRRFFR